MSGKSFKVRPGPGKTKDGPFQATISDQFLKDYGGCNQASAWIIGKRTVPVLLWRETVAKNQQAQTSSGRIILLSDTVRRMGEISLGDEVHIVKDEDVPREADSVVLSDPDPQDEVNDKADLSSAPSNVEVSEEIIQQAGQVLADCNFIACGQQIDIRSRPGYPLEIKQINGSREKCVYRVCGMINVKFVPRTQLMAGEISREDIFGLNNVLDHLDDISWTCEDTSALEAPFARPDFAFVLLTGPTGSGKSLIMEAVARQGWQKVFRLKAGAKLESRIDAVFDQANQLGCALILVDDYQDVKNDRHEHRKLITKLQSCKKIYRTKKNLRILLLAEAWTSEDFESTLFDEILEVGLPTLEVREQVLRKCMEFIPGNETTVRELARQTPAFTIGDLQKLTARTYRKLSRRPTKNADTWLATAKECLKNMSPTLMHGLRVVVPETRFSDIGGQKELKDFLERNLRNALMTPELRSVAGLRPAKGLLMYGPPGCSKTLLAKAVATEFGLNFLLVNAAELIGSYVGESEKQVRELFRRARDASPCIIFFDEFDTLGGKRSEAHKGLYVVNTLLTELDGVRPLDGVFVLAATNAPETLDQALLRPGRLHPHVMVGPPDQEARLEIMRIRLQKVNDEFIDDTVDLDLYARWSNGLTGAETVAYIENVLRVWEQERTVQMPVRLSHRHFEVTKHRIIPSVSADQLRYYREWGESISV